MIKVSEAKKIISENAKKTGRKIKMNLKDSHGSVLAENIISKTDLPPFDQSNVDGYAVSASENGEWLIKGEIIAGDFPGYLLQKNEAVRIFTGAALPENTHAVLMQENVIAKGNRLFYTRGDILKGSFIRKKGTQIKKGDTALRAGTVINPAVMGFIASMGFNSVKVYVKPVVSLIITGNEIQQPGKKLGKGKVYDSNSILLSSLLENSGYCADKIIFVKDKKNELMKAVGKQLECSDVILISGGVSVGKYDFVNEVLDELKVKRLFYKVSQRPGKPLYFGRKAGVFVFGLPGNPASVFTCYYIYVMNLLNRISGIEKNFPATGKIPVLREIEKNFSLSWFLRGKLTEKGVMPLDGQASFMLRTLTEADCFIFMPAGKKKIRKNEPAEVYFFGNKKF